MNRHPGGKRNTLRLLEMAGLAPPARILDAGSGAGETVELLRELGFETAGADIKDGVDFLNLPYEDGSFDAVISECAFYVSGNQSRAIEEAFRVLKKGGTLMLADLFFDVVPFETERMVDITIEWREYWLEKLWTEDDLCYVPGSPKYFLLTARK